MRKIDTIDFQGPESGFAKTEVSSRNQLTDRAASIGAFEAPARQATGSNNLAAGKSAAQPAIPLSARTPVWPRVFPGL
jgi:hypothetical protein